METISDKAKKNVYSESTKPPTTSFLIKKICIGAQEKVKVMETLTSDDIFPNQKNVQELNKK